MSAKQKRDNQNAAQYQSVFSSAEHKQIIVEQRELVGAVKRNNSCPVAYNALLKFWADKRIKFLTSTNKCLVDASVWA